MNPKGDFVTFYGKNNEADTLADSITDHVEQWAKENAEYKKDHPKYKGVKQAATAGK